MVGSTVPAKQRKRSIPKTTALLFLKDGGVVGDDLGLKGLKVRTVANNLILEM